MHGYAERFDFDNQTIGGWVFDVDAESNRDVRVVAAFDGHPVGEGRPNGSRDDLLKITTQDTTFSLRCTRKFSALDVVSGRLRVTAYSGGREAVLRFTANGLTVLKKAAVRDLNGVATAAPWSQADLDAVKPQVEKGNMSPVLLPAGLRSPSKTAAIGLRGHLFLTDGSNSLLSQYRAPVDDALTSQVGRWVELFAQRREQCEARGITYLQTVLPEKMTVLRADAPLRIDAPSPLYQELENRLGGEDFYISGLEPFEQWSSSEDDPFLMADTHLSATGAQKVFLGLAARMDPQVVPVVNAIRMNEVRYATGDLTAHFGLPIYSRIVEPSRAQVAAYGEGLTVLEKYFPPTNRSIGRRFRWANSTAPSALRVLVFGSSSFSIGDFAGNLSWWGKHCFSEFHFHWGPDFDWDLVDQLKPDVVVGQTVERFLNRVATV